MEEIKYFSGESIFLQYLDCGILYRYIVPKYKREVLIYSDSLNDNPFFTVTYDSDGVIKYMELYRNNSTELMYINFHDYEHAKKTIYQYSCYWGDWISEKIIERKEKVSRLFIDYLYDYDLLDFSVNAYTPEDVQKVIDNCNYIGAEDNTCVYCHDNDIIPDIKTLRIMLFCIDYKFCDELYEFAMSVMIQRIKENTDKIDKTDDFKFIAEEQIF
ncbi:MAG: hypothetical protein NC040_03000 [Muribaculaceae bacterium]|nr:hypothetical protein [Muribaculaceae bacterium]